MNSEPTPIELPALNDPGYEVWVRRGTSESSHRLLPQLLIVLFEEGAKPLKIIDPGRNNEEILSTADYVEIVDYLREEDYKPIF